MKRRMLILAEGKFSPMMSKTANGAIAYLTDEVVAIVDSLQAGTTAQQVLGYGGEIPVVASIDDGVQYKPDTMLIGIAPAGGRLPQAWRDYITTALRHRLHIISGLHTFLGDDPEFSRLAREQGCTIADLRKPKEESLRVAKGNWKHRKAKTVLAVGTDCRIGKMTTILEMHKELRKRKVNSDFIATGQTGIAIAGKGVSVDAVIGDYIAGSIEHEIDISDAEGHELIMVEGQGALTHQGYSSVTLGLMHGTMPDAMILCHQPARLKDDYGQPLPDLNAAIRLHEEVINFFHPTRVVGIGINSVGLTPEEGRAACEAIERQTGLPAVDAFKDGAAKLVDGLLEYLKSQAGTSRPVAIH
jgi:D-glutamate N-acetyltransferase